MTIFWRIGGAILGLVAAYLLVTMYGSARYAAGKADEAKAWTAKQADAGKAQLAAYQDGLAHRDAAATVYRETIRQLPPVTTTILDRTAAYAATPSGARECLAADRVFGIEQARAGLFPAPPAPAAAGAVGAVPAGDPRPQP